MAAAIFHGTKVKLLKNNLEFKNGVTLATTATDATILDTKLGEYSSNFVGFAGTGLRLAQSASNSGLIILTEDHTNNSSGNGKEIDITTGYKPGAGSTGDTGNFYLSTGVNEGSGNSGFLATYTGYVYGAGNSGALIYETGGAFGSGNSGDITMDSGSADSGNSGKVSLFSGNSTSGNSGNVEFSIGTAGGTQGVFKFLKLGVPSVVDQVWRATATDGTGYWGSVPALTALTGDVTASGSGSQAATLSNTGVSAGSYTYASITVDAKGRLSAASSGTTPALTDLSNLAVTTAVSQDLLMASGKTLRLPNNTALIGRNAANSANLNLLTLNNSNVVIVGSNSTSTQIIGNGITINSNSAAGSINLNGYINNTLEPNFSTYDIGSTTFPWNNSFFVAYKGRSASNTRFTLDATTGQTTPSGTTLAATLYSNLNTSGGRHLGLFSPNDSANDANATGDVYLETGNKSHASATGSSGSILIKSGDVANSGNSGNLILRSGTSGSGTRGYVQFDALVAVLPTGTSNPSTSYPTGSCYYNTSDDKIYVLRSGTWRATAALT